MIVSKNEAIAVALEYAITQNPEATNELLSALRQVISKELQTGIALNTIEITEHLYQSIKSLEGIGEL